MNFLRRRIFGWVGAAVLAVSSLAVVPKANADVLCVGAIACDDSGCLILIVCIAN